MEHNVYYRDKTVFKKPEFYFWPKKIISLSKNKFYIFM